MISYCYCCCFRFFILLSLITISVVQSRQTFPTFHRHAYVDNNDDTTRPQGQRWAILIAGSSGYMNYRHQADVCHAYQFLKNGGLKDDNIVVFMYNDIALSEYNPRQGIIINKPNGTDVYKGVPKDYTGDKVNIHNLFAVILGNKTGITGGSGKVVKSGPDDRIFIFYTDHGGAGLLGMPYGADLTAQDLINVLKKKHETKSYKSMVIYVEACESGSMFEGILPRNLDIYAVTASNSHEESWGTYCPGDYPPPPPEFDTCLGDLFSISWMEDSDIHDLRNETLEQQYNVVRRRTGFDSLNMTSHVMQFGSLEFEKDFVFSYLGTNPRNDEFAAAAPNSDRNPINLPNRAISQRDAGLLHFWHKFLRAPEGSPKKAEAHKELVGELSYRKQIDESINEIIKTLFGHKNIEPDMLLESVHPAGKPLVDDWNCFKMLVNSFKKYCGSRSVSRYEMKYSRGFANMCNVGVDVKQATAAIIEACSDIYSPSS